MATASLRHAAEALAGRLPPLLVEAERVAATVSQGIHGRRRVGSGDSFWQFRPYSAGDASSRIDWRQTAKSGRAYIRENEWEAAQSVFLWVDRSPSMQWRSDVALPDKSERATVLLLALAAMLLRGGERVALIGEDAGFRSGGRLDRMALALSGPASDAGDLPPPTALNRHATVVVMGDLLSPLDQIRARIDGFAAQGVKGHLLQVLDPAEETLPFDGRVRFEGLQHEASHLISRVEGIRGEYQQRLAMHRAGLSEIASRHGWSFATHRTDHPPHAALLALYTVMAGLS